MEAWHTTSVILDQLLQKEPRAWELFLERFRGPLVAFGRKLGLSDTDADDAAQETVVAFMEALERGAYDRSKGRLGRWLFGIAYRQIASLRRDRLQTRARPVDAAGATQFWAEVPDEASASKVWDEE